MPRSERKQNSLRHSPITIYWFSRLSWRLINAAQTDIQDSDKKKKVTKQKSREVVEKEKKKYRLFIPVVRLTDDIDEPRGLSHLCVVPRVWLVVSWSLMIR
ncbi:hypothetical protein CEXT_616101 [Caerostris extrusa]|uniref:Uncharacterized protein n=1 Tax=Caerostris extrusa TaxID=172846 RepID=A0AAV4X414_CAEEX|nr:hypothetical protein CEXT_616101 [Caerostris extrusa]